MHVLLSIKPRFVKEIKSGNKKFEFRKSLVSRKNWNKIEKVFIYSSSPVKRIVARFFIKQILEDHPRILWENCKDFSGIEKTEFFQYFGGREKGVAIEFSGVKFYTRPIDPKEVFSKFVAPQSFCYIEDIEGFKKIPSFL